MLRQALSRGTQSVLRAVGQRWQTSNAITGQLLWAPLSKEAHEKMIELGVEVPLPVVDLNGSMAQLADLYPDKPDLKALINDSLKGEAEWNSTVSINSKEPDPINWSKLAMDFNPEFVEEQKAIAEALLEAAEELPPIFPVMDEDSVQEMKNLLLEIEQEIESVDRMIIMQIAIWKEIYEYFARLDHYTIKPDLERRMNPQYAKECDKDISQDLNYSATYFFEGCDGCPEPPKFHVRRWQVGLDQAMEEYDLPNPAPNSSYPKITPSTKLDYDMPRFWVFERYNQLLHQRANIPYDGPERKNMKNPGKNIFVHDLKTPVGSM